MAVQILSDLHLEAGNGYNFSEVVPRAPYLALLGDIGNVVVHRVECFGFLTRQLAKFRAILFVPGNHEAYQSNWPDTLTILRAFEEHARADPSLGEFILLDRVAFRPPGTNIAILGCSLFSCVPPESQMAVGQGLNDFFQTSGWGVDAHNEAHKRDLAWLNQQVADLELFDVKIMILSHWSPSKDVRAIEPRHYGSPVTSAFSTDLSREPCFRSDKVKLWAFGHTHYNCDFVVQREGGAGPLRVVTNQKGYHFAQAEGYDGEKTVEV